MLDPRLRPAIIEAGARHLPLALDSRSRLTAMAYDLDAGRQLTGSADLVTIALVSPKPGSCSTLAMPLPRGGHEDPATGAAAAALAGYLRDLGWPHEGKIEIRQGEGMGMPSRIAVQITPGRGDSVYVSGDARLLASP